MSHLASNLVAVGWWMFCGAIVGIETARQAQRRRGRSCHTPRTEWASTEERRAATEAVEIVNAEWDRQRHEDRRAARLRAIDEFYTEHPDITDPRSTR